MFPSDQENSKKQQSVNIPIKLEETSVNLNDSFLSAISFQHSDLLFNENQNIEEMKEKQDNSYQNFDNQVKIEQMLEMEEKSVDKNKNKIVEKDETEFNLKNSKLSSPGLKQWARRTFGLIQKHGELSFLELDSYLSSKQNFVNKSEKSKNRKRRIYDAINVAVSQSFLKKYKVNKKGYIKKTKEIIGLVNKEMLDKKKKQLMQYEELYQNMKHCRLRQ